VPTSETAPLRAKQGPSIRWPRLPGAALGLNIATESTLRPFLVVVAESPREFHALDDEIRFFLGRNNDQVVCFPGWETLAYDRFSPHPEIVSQRIAALASLSQPHAVLLVTVEQLLLRLSATAFIRANSFTLAAGQEIDSSGFRDRLIDCGYLPVSKVSAPGDFAVRGGIIDVFPTGTERPFRLDLFGTELEKIRFFDPITQKSLGDASFLSILPAREFPTDANAIETFRRNYRRAFEGDPQASAVYQNVTAGRFPAGIEYYLPLFFDDPASLFDYVPPDTAWIFPKDIESLLAVEWARLNDRFNLFSLDAERPPLPPDLLALTPSEVLSRLYEHVCITTGHSKNISDSCKKALDPPNYQVDHHSAEPFSALVNRLKKSGGPAVALSVESENRLNTLNDLLHSYGIKTERMGSWQAFLEGANEHPGLIISPLDRGLLLEGDRVELIVESQLYGGRSGRKKRRGRSIDPEAIIRSIAELKTDDPIVHADHGVGRFKGLEFIEIDGQRGEFVVVAYEGGGKLYVPVVNIGVLSRYIGGDGDTAPLHKLGGDHWIKARQHAQKRAFDVAAELLKTQALRTVRPGTPFEVPVIEYERFRSEFPYEETPDQEAAIEAVINDLKAPNPMDRLVCGDVGFGKTEVALRAAFIAVHNNHQVSLLAPTTLLASQHLETFRSRLQGYPIRIESLSRFQSDRDAKQILEDLANGAVDIIIGTHRLLQKDIRFRGLGLVIIDEEHRFGVRQKERLKQMREEVDVLTLTATPIPRTLNIALSGIKSVSLIASPPAGRVAIQTSVQPYSEAIIKEACGRELHRGGQVYFLHNDVSSIERMAEHLRQLLPNAGIQVAHGQMPRTQLEPVMRDFYHQRFDILVCSTIIESGIDVPTANTIIINRADRFGLAQLHQLRGRVGRSKHQAFAFLLTPDPAAVSETAERRLTAIAELTDLGVGFALANHDLEIRGAGEILGEDQSGAIEEIGFSLYTEYLNRAIHSLADSGQLRSGLDPSLDEKKTDIDLYASAFLPDTYLPDVYSRLVFYQRLASTFDEAELYELKLEMLDRFGPLPGEAEMLFLQTRLRLRATHLGILEIRLSRTGGSFIFEEEAKIDPSGIGRLLSQERTVFKMISPIKMRIVLELPDAIARAELCSWVLDELDPESESVADLASVLASGAMEGITY